HTQPLRWLVTLPWLHPDVAIIKDQHPTRLLAAIGQRRVVNAPAEQVGCAGPHVQPHLTWHSVQVVGRRHREVQRVTVRPRDEGGGAAVGTHIGQRAEDLYHYGGARAVDARQPFVKVPVVVRRAARQRR